MESFKCVALLFCLTASFASSANPKPSAVGEKKVVCYFTVWSGGRPEPYGFTPSKIDPFVCTHIIYAFGDIGQDNSLITSNAKYDIDQGAYANITALKTKNKNLKVMLGIGGWVGGTEGFGRISGSETNRTDFSKNAVRFLRGYRFDGLDLNWQTPTLRKGGKPEDKKNYVLLAQALREEFQKDATNRGKPRMLLSVAISHHNLEVYDIQNFNNYMDFINVICYDYSFSYEGVLNHHSPLYSLEDDKDYNYDATKNVNHTIHYFLEYADADKLVLGIPTYGRSYKLVDPQETSIGSEADGPGDKGPFTGEKGFLAYYEICNFVKEKGWKVVQSKEGSVGPYAYQGNQWVGYDDLQMIRNKAMYAKDLGLGGVMFWTVDYDDFVGTCHGRKFPVISAAKDVLWSDSLASSEAPIGTPAVSTNTWDQPSMTQAKIPLFAPPTPTRPQLDNWPTPPRPVPVNRMPVRHPAENTYNWLPAQSPGKTALTPSANDEQPCSTGKQRYTPRHPIGHEERPADPDVSDSHSQIVSDLIHLIERSGGMNNFCRLLRQETWMSGGEQRRVYNENAIVYETQNTPPILLVLTNSSVYIKEVNIYNKP